MFVTFVLASFFLRWVGTAQKDKPLRVFDTLSIHSNFNEICKRKNFYALCVGNAAPLRSLCKNTFCGSNRTSKNFEKHTKNRNFVSKLFRKRPHSSEGIRRCPNIFECVRTGPNGSRRVQKLLKTLQTCQYIEK